VALSIFIHSSRPRAISAQAGFGRFAMAMQGALIKFQVQCPSTKPDEAVFVCGSVPQLGSWSPQGAFPLATTPKVFPLWASESLVLPADCEQVEFKVLIQKADGSAPDAATWAGGENQSFEVPKSSGKQAQVTVSCVWGEPEVTIRTKYAAAAAATGDVAKEKESAGGAKGEAAADDGEDAGESADQVGELKKIVGRHTSRAFGMGSFSHSSGPLSMPRKSSRHLCIGNDGMLNTEMSRTPSLMLVEVEDLESDCKAHKAQIDALEREKLNEVQRRMPSGSLLANMKEIIAAADLSNVVLLQGFNWESWRAGGGDWYGVVKKNIGVMKTLGVTDIWLPPPSQSVAPQGYLPSQLFNLDGSKYGNRESLEGLVKALHENDIRAVADIVINHRCGDKQDGEGRWNQFTTTGIEHRPSFAGVMDWGGWAITLGDNFSDGTGENHPGQFDGKFDAAPDIDHGNKRVQESICIWMRWLQLQVGFDAWRFDFVKGYAANFVGHYCKKSAPAWAVGELWCDMAYDDNGLCHNQDKHRQDTVNWINGTDKECTAFDFTTKGVLQEAVRNCEYWRLRDSNGKPPGVIGWMPTHAVTFIDNHDTGSTQRHWPFPDDKVLVGYAYILTHPGIPSIFWDHVFDWGEHHRSQIVELARARRESGIPVDAPVNIQCADADLYLVEVGSPPALRVALGPRHACEPDGSYWQSAVQGNQYRVWIHRPEAPQAASPPEITPGEGGKAPSPETTVPKVTVSFPPIELDGKKLTADNLKAMSKDELGRVCAKLEPVVKAAKDLLAA